MALLVGMVLNGMGVAWLAYPSNVMVIATVAVGVYLVRTILKDAYFPLERAQGKTVAVLVISIVLSVAPAIVAFSKALGSWPQTATTVNDNSALILLAVSGTSLLAFAVAVAGKGMGRKDDGDE